LTNYLASRGFTGPDASAAANGYLYQQLQNQVRLLSFTDCFRVIAWMTFGSAALLLLIQRFKPAGKPQAGH
jgi:MFS transporter, DHA2 family, multidrug resistance protein